MQGSISLLTEHVIAAVALAAYRCVNFGGNYPTAAADIYGATTMAGAVGEATTVCLVGTALIESGAAVTAGVAVATDATGRIVPWTTGVKVGRALTAAAAAGTIVEVLLFQTASAAVSVPSAGTVQFSSASYSAAEGTATVTLTVTRTGGSSGAASVAYATSNGTATAGSDYTAVSGTLNWADGDAANKTFTVAITDDAAVESAETFTATLSSATSAALGTPAAATVTIADNDSAGGADATPSLSYGLANPTGDAATFASIFATTTPLTGATSGGRTGSFSTASSVTNYSWIRVKASAAGATLRVYDGTGYGAWSGAKSTGIGATPADQDPIADAFHTWTDANGVLWNCYRTNGKASNFPTWSIS